MKSTILRTGLVAALFFANLGFSQETENFSNMRKNDQRGLNQFEDTKDTSSFDGIKVKWGAAFTAQFQSLKHENDVDYTANPNTAKLYDLKQGIQVPMANLYMDVQLAEGIRLNVSSYMSSRHHNEFYVKGGYLQIDKLPFNNDFLDKVMEKITIKAGQFENNYGDAHFRRTDGGQAIYNPFIENYIIDAFTTEVGGEVYYYPAKNWTVMGGVTSGSIKGHVTTPNEDADSGKKTRSLSLYGKVAYDTKISDDARIRLAGSLYHNPHNGGSGLTLFWGDRTGSNYQLVMEPAGTTSTTKLPVLNADGTPTGEYTTTSTFTASSPASQAWSGRYNPLFSGKLTTAQFNAFAQYKGLEFFGTYENASGRQYWETENRNMSQFAAELIYRFGGESRNLFLGARYNAVNLDAQLGNAANPRVQEVKLDRTAFAAGYFLTKNIMLKGEYVTQNYKDFPTTDYRYGGKFKGVAIEATVSF